MGNTTSAFGGLQVNVVNSKSNNLNFVKPNITKKAKIDKVHTPSSPSNNENTTITEKESNMFNKQQLNANMNNKISDNKISLKGNGGGFLISKPRKGGKCPPKDPSLSRVQRLTQKIQDNYESQNSRNFQIDEEEKEQEVNRNHIKINSIVDYANSLSVNVKVEDSDNKPQRRLRPKAPSSTSSFSCSGSDASDCSSLEENFKEPISLRSFDILKVLGKGSHGKVYLVRHLENDKLYAMKELKKSDVHQNKQVENTIREFKTNLMLVNSEVQCPNIAKLHFAFHTRSKLYMVFDYCAGGELYYHIGQRGRLPETLARFYISQIALAIGFLHSKNIAYRDLKPENLMLDEKGNIHLVDLGLCKDDISSPTTGSSSFCGTVEYLAPEILDYKEHGLAVDWWSFGMVLYEMLTGLPPWYSYKQEEVVKGILKGNLEFPAYLSEDAKDLIGKLLDRNPGRRIGSDKGVEDIIDHPFFKEVDWFALARREIEPPFKPPSSKSDLANNFDVEFTSSKIGCDHDYCPPSKNDLFGRFYYDSEDPVVM